MLTITDAAAEVVRSLLTQYNMPEGSGLRISRKGTSTRSEGLDVSITKAPAQDEIVVDSNGVRIFLHPALATSLEGQQIGIEEMTDDGGEEQLHFTVDPKPKSRN